MKKTIVLCLLVAAAPLAAFAGAGTGSQSDAGGSASVFAGTGFISGGNGSASVSSNELAKDAVQAAVPAAMDVLNGGAKTDMFAAGAQAAEALTQAHFASDDAAAVAIVQLAETFATQAAAAAQAQ